MASSYRAKFKTRKDEWIEVRIPLDKFEATSFGRVIRNQQLEPGEGRDVMGDRWQDLRRYAGFRRLGVSSTQQSPAAPIDHRERRIVPQ